MNKEQWKKVIGWDGYEVSNLGRVRSIDRVRHCRDGQIQRYKGKMLSPRVTENGYLCLRLRDGFEKTKTVRVHRLVADAFIQNPDDKPCVNHIDCNPQNNNVNNLEWCTQKENLDHMTELGRRSAHWRGKRSPNAKLTDVQARNIRLDYKGGGHTHQILADKYGTNKKTVTDILNNKTYLPQPPKE